MRITPHGYALVRSAGLAPRRENGGTHPSRWIGYFSVSDIDAAVAAVTRDGGTVHAPSHKFPDRGMQAIVADKDGNPFGLLQSSSGDPTDGEPLPGDWNWFEFYVRSPKDTADFYHDAVGFDVAGTDWKLSVADNGIGAPVGGFAQAKTGLGTSIINALAQQLDARVDVLSGAEGTTVSITHATFAKLH